MITNTVLELRLPALNPRKVIQEVSSTIKDLKRVSKELHRDYDDKILGYNVYVEGIMDVDNIENDEVYQRLKRWNQHWKYLAEKKWEARHRTIALAIANGTPIHCIETMPTKPKKEYRKPDWALVAKYVGEATYYRGFQYKRKPKVTV